MTESPGSLNHMHGVRNVRGRLLVEGRLVDGTVAIAGDRIAEVRLGSSARSGEAAELEAAIVSPGLVDLQVNGAFGLEVGGDAEALRGLAARLPATGVTAFLPALVSSTPDHYRDVAGAFEAARGAAGARMLGLHLEGPLLSAHRVGAHARAAILAADATLDEVLPELVGRGLVRVVTLAPERPGALARVARLVASGVAVSLGHTDASFDQMVAGATAGATLCTHLYNAMSPFHHRAPGAVGAALTDDRLTVTVIADGIHADPAALNLALRAKGPQGIALVTDAIAAAGAPPGRYQLGGIPVVSDGGSARLEDGTLAGSTLTMDRAVRAMVSLGGARVEDALAMASAVPAARIGAPDLGTIAAGQRADLALWDANMEVAATIVAGQVVFRAR